MSFNLRNRSLLTVQDFTQREFQYLLDLARDLKRAKYARTERANGDSAAECCRHWQAQPGAIEKRSAILRRRLQDPLRRNSTGRLSLDCLSEA